MGSLYLVFLSMFIEGLGFRLVRGRGFLSQPPVAARGHWPPVALASEADFLRAPGEGTGEKAPRPPGLRFRKRHLNFM